MEVLRVVESKSKNRMPGIFKAGTLAISTLLKPEQLDSKDKNLYLKYEELDSLSQPDWNHEMLKMIRGDGYKCVMLKMFRGDGYKREMLKMFGDYLKSNLETNIPKLDKMISELIKDYLRLKDVPQYSVEFSKKKYLEELKAAVIACVAVLISVTVELNQKVFYNRGKVFVRTLEYLEKYLTELRKGVLKIGKIMLFLSHAPEDAASAVAEFKEKFNI